MVIIKDIDECASGTHDCHSDATCTNTGGAFNCTCKEGYNGDGRQCAGTDANVVITILFELSSQFSKHVHKINSSYLLSPLRSLFEIRKRNQHSRQL